MDEELEKRVYDKVETIQNLLYLLLKQIKSRDMAKGEEMALCKALLSLNDDVLMMLEGF